MIVMKRRCIFCSMQNLGRCRFFFLFLSLSCFLIISFSLSLQLSEPHIMWAWPFSSTENFVDPKRKCKSEDSIKIGKRMIKKTEITKRGAEKKNMWENAGWDTRVMMRRSRNVGVKACLWGVQTTYRPVQPFPAQPRFGQTERGFTPLASCELLLN